MRDVVGKEKEEMVDEEMEEEGQEDVKKKVMKRQRSRWGRKIRRR